MEDGSKPLGRNPSANQPAFFARLNSLRTLAGGRELWALSDQALVSGANFLTNLLLARSLGLSGFGVYALSWSVVLLMSGLQMAVIISPMMSIAPKQHASDRATYFGAVAMHEVIFAGLSSLLLYVFTLAFARLFPAWHARPLAFPLSLVSGAYLLQDFARRYFFTIGKSRLAIASDGLSYLTQVPLLAWFAHIGRLTPATALIIVGLTSLFSLFVSLWWRESMQFSRGAALAVARRHWPFVRWLVPSACLQWASQNLILVFAPVLYGAAAAGALRACQNVVAIAHVWFLGLENIVTTDAASQLRERGLDGLHRYLRQVLQRWGSLTLCFVVLVGSVPSLWLHLLYGAQYASFGYVLRLYGLLYLITFLGVPLRGGLQAVEYVLPTLWSYGVTTLFAALAAEPLARRFGLVGVLCGLILSQILFQGILAFALLRRTRQMHIQEQQAALQFVRSGL